MYKVNLCAVALLVLIGGINGLNCARQQGKVNCCDGYIWNISSQKCIKCMAGFSGKNCTSRCPFPSYGEECQSICKCNKSLCDISTGCPITTVAETSVIPTTFSISTAAGDAKNYNFSDNSNNSHYTTASNNKDFVRNSFLKRNFALVILVISLGSFDLVLLILYICTYIFTCLNVYANQSSENIVFLVKENHYEDIGELTQNLRNP